MLQVLTYEWLNTLLISAIGFLLITGFGILIRVVFGSHKTTKEIRENQLLISGDIQVVKTNVHNLSNWTKDIDEMQKKHDSKINQHSEEIAYLKAKTKN